MNGFSAADMSTAAANEFRDGLAAQPAAAQEAVAWQVGDEFYPSESLAIEAIQQWGPSGSIAIPLYAAPVAAAPVDDGMLPDALVPYSKEWYMLCERRFAVDKIKISGDLTCAIVDAISQRPASTPAAPGIDLSKLRELAEAIIASLDESPFGNASTAIAMRRAKQIVALTGASHKGGSDERARFEAWAKSRSYSVDSYGQQRARELKGQLAQRAVYFSLETCAEITAALRDAPDAVALRVAMETLEQIATTPRNKGARMNAKATLLFLQTQGAAGRAAPEGWMIRKDGAGIAVTAPDGIPGGMTVKATGKSLQERLLYALCDALLTARPQGVK